MPRDVAKLVTRAIDEGIITEEEGRVVIRNKDHALLVHEEEPDIAEELPPNDTAIVLRFVAWIRQNMQ